MSDFVYRIYDFNKQSGLLDSGYSDPLESSFQIEEALEGFKDIGYLQQRLDERGQYTPELATPKECARQIVRLASRHNKENIPDVERLDKACDAIVFAVGSIVKLGLSPEQVHEALNIVMDANSAKIGCKRDSHGKLMKPDNFPEPQPKLQSIIDSIYKNR